MCEVRYKQVLGSICSILLHLHWYARNIQLDMVQGRGCGSQILQILYNVQTEIKNAAISVQMGGKMLQRVCKWEARGVRRGTPCHWERMWGSWGLSHMHACMHVCICIYIYIYASVSVYVYAHVSVSVHVSVYVYVCKEIYIYTSTSTNRWP